MGKNEQEKQTLWKTYGILMGTMLGGALLILGVQAVWNQIQAEKARQQMEQARQAALEEETYGRYTELLNKLSTRNNLTLPTSDRSSDIQKAKQYCSIIDADKANLKQDWGLVPKAATTNPKIQSKQAILLSQIQIYCEQNVSKLPKEAQDVLANLDHLTKEEAIEIIKFWQEAKPRIFADPFDRKLAERLTTGKLLADIIQPGGSIEWLQNNNAYYVYKDYKIEPTNYFKSGSKQAEIEVKIKQEMTLYINGRSEHKFDSSRYRYGLVFENASWKIATRQERQ